MTDYEYEMEMQYEMGAALGDPRTCPRHPGVKTSSPDGMHDGLCGACEAEMDFDDEVDAARADGVDEDDQVKS